MPNKGVLVDNGCAYILPGGADALVLTAGPKQDDPDAANFAVAVMLRSGKLIQICTADSHQKAKDKLADWARVFDGPNAV